MAKDPAVLFYTSDFLTGTSFFNYEEKGQYITLLCQQHQLWSIPENHMISICGSLDSPVIKKFKKDADGNYYNERMRLEAEKRANYCNSRSNNRSGRPKKKKKKKSYDYHMSQHMENENDNENDNIKKDAEKVINFLNEKTGRNFKDISFIIPRLKEGKTVDQCKQIVLNQCQDEYFINNPKFLNPQTLFRPSHWDKYLNNIPDPDRNKVSEITRENIQSFENWEPPS